MGYRRSFDVQHGAGWSVALATALIALCLCVLPVRGAWASEYSVFGDVPNNLDAIEAIVMDENGNVLYSLEGDSPMCMASTTKMMTAVVALESGMSLDTVYVMSDYAASISGSVIGYWAGQHITLNDLLHGLLVHSGNDAAIAIAECVAGSEAAFVDMMNAKAVELGLTLTRYTNPHGLDEYGHYSTARDLANLARHAMQIPLFRSIVGMQMVTLMVNGEMKTFTNTNTLVGEYPGMVGIKTGYTYGAGNALVGCATRGGVTLFGVVLGCETTSQRFTNMEKILNWGFAHYPETVAVAASDRVSTVDIPTRFGWVMGTYPTSAMSYRVSALSTQIPKIVVYLFDAYYGDQVLGTATLTVDGVVVGSRTLVAAGWPMHKHEFGMFNSELFY